MKISSYSFIFIFIYNFSFFIYVSLKKLSERALNIQSNEDPNNEELENKNKKEVIFSLESGYYDTKEIKELTLTSNDTIIYYTLDSSDPTTSETAKIYKKPIPMYDRSSDPNVYSKYQHEENSPYSTTTTLKYTANSALFDKLTVVRAVSLSDKGEFSKITTKVYFVMDSEKLSLYSKIPIVSIVTNPENLYDKNKGIYICGQNYVDWKNGPDYDPSKTETDAPANFLLSGKEWEREASITYFEKGKLGFSQKMGIRIKGNASRNSVNKGFNIFAKSKYGKSTVDYVLLDNNKNFIDDKIIEKYKSFGVKGMCHVERLRDYIIQKPLNELPEIATYTDKKCLLFLEGEFWGFYDLLEKSSVYFIESNYDIPSENVSLVKTYEIKDGPENELAKLNQLKHYIRDNNMTVPENYEHVSSLIDIQSLIYHCIQAIYVGTYNWPNENYLIWRNNGKKIEGNPYSDGKWRFGSFDFDYSAGYNPGNNGDVEEYEFDFIQKFYKDKINYYPAFCFFKLLDNPDFKKKSIEAMDYFANKIYEAEKMNNIINDQLDKYLKYIVMSSWRWTNDDPSVTFEKYEKWHGDYIQNQMDIMKEFFNKRGKFAIKQLNNFLGIEDSN